MSSRRPPAPSLWLVPALLVVLAAPAAWADLFGGDVPLLGTLVTQGSPAALERDPAHPHRQRAAHRGQAPRRVRAGGEDCLRGLPALLAGGFRRRRHGTVWRRSPCLGCEPSRQRRRQLGSGDGRAPCGGPAVPRLRGHGQRRLPPDARRHHPGRCPGGAEPHLRHRAPSGDAGRGLRGGPGALRRRHPRPAGDVPRGGFRREPEAGLRQHRGCDGVRTGPGAHGRRASSTP